MKKKILSLLLAFCMVVTMVPAAFAGETDGTTVTTKDDLIAAVQAGGTVTLGADISLTDVLTVSENVTVTLDLADHTLTQTGTKTRYDDNGNEYQGAINGINNYGTLTITGNGTITGAWNCVYNAGTLTIENGTCQATNNAIYNGDNYEDDNGNPVTVDATLTINGGTFEATNYNGVYVALGNVVINGGTFKSTYGSGFWNDGGTVTISGGDFSEYNTEDGYAVFNDSDNSDSDDSGTVMITNGNYTSGEFYDCTVTGGTFGECCKVTGNISGGTFNGEAVVGTVTGGTFNGTVTCNSGASLSNCTINGEIAISKNAGAPTLSSVTFGESATLTNNTTSQKQYKLVNGSIIEKSKYTVSVSSADTNTGTVTVTKHKVGTSSGSSSTAGNKSWSNVYEGSTASFTAKAAAKDNYVFRGWYSDNSGTTLLSTDNPVTYTTNSETGLTGDASYYAVFETSTAYTERVQAATKWLGTYDSTNAYTISSVEDMVKFATAVNDLKKDFSGKTVTLSTDLDFASTTYTPVGVQGAAFNGTFDGGNKTLSNITATAYYCGVFGNLGSKAVIKNLTVKNSTFTATYFGGAIAAAGAGTITDCTVEGCIVNGDGYTFIGGAVGHTDAALTMTNVTVNNTTVNGDWKSGGLVGYTGGTLTATGCKVTSVTSTGSGLFGQAVGHINSNTTLENLTASGDSKNALIATTYSTSKTVTITGKDTSVEASAIFGSTANATVTIENGSYTVSEPTTVTSGSTVTVKSTAKINAAEGTDKLFVVEPNGTLTIESDNGTSTGVTAPADGTDEGNYVDANGNIILEKGAAVNGTATDVGTVILSDGTIVKGTETEAPTVKTTTDPTTGEIVTKVTVPTGGSVQKAGSTNITVMSGGGSLQSDKSGVTLELAIRDSATLEDFAKQVKNDPTVCGTVTANIDMSGQSWTPIGTKANPYTGTFDGGGYTISGLRVSSSSSGGYVGLFGCIGSVGTVQNVKLKSVSISASGKAGYAGAICGYNNGGMITNCTVTGTVSTCGQSGSSGGICGYNAGTIMGCTSSVKVTASGKSAYAGGICGYNAKAGTLTKCTNSGAVTTSGKSGKAGGICGYNAGTIKSCSNTGKIRATGQSGKLGKIYGYNSGKVS